MSNLEGQSMADIWLAWLIGSPQSENGQSRRPRRFSGMLRLRYGERGHCGCPTRASHLEHFAKDQRAGQEMASCGDVAFCSCSSLLADASRGFLPSPGLTLRPRQSVRSQIGLRSKVCPLQMVTQAHFARRVPTVDMRRR